MYSRGWSGRRPSIGLTKGWADERGSAPVEFLFVSILLTTLTLAVMQLGFALLVRNTVLDAASEGARYASLAGNSAADGVARTQELLTTALGAEYAQGVSTATVEYLGVTTIEIMVDAPLPLLGPLGIADGLEVAAHAPVEDRSP